jgi:hypothetical protein
MILLGMLAFQTRGVINDHVEQGSVIFAEGVLPSRK